MPESSPSAMAPVASAPARALISAFSAYVLPVSSGSVAPGTSASSMQLVRHVAEQRQQLTPLGAIERGDDEARLYSLKVRSARASSARRWSATRRRMPRSARARSVVEAAAAERHLLGGALHLDELAAARHHDVHVDLGRRVLGVVQIERRLAGHDAHADRGHAVAQHGGGGQAGNPRDGVGQGHEAAGDGGGARAAVGLDHVAVHPHRALAELGAIGHRAQRAADEALDLLRAAARPAVLAVSCACWSSAAASPYSAVTQPSPWPFRKCGTLSSTVAVQITLVAPNSTSTEPSGCSR